MGVGVSLAARGGIGARVFRRFEDIVFECRAAAGLGTRDRRRFRSNCSD
jgi:hypothetical protein